MRLLLVAFVVSLSSACLYIPVKQAKVTGGSAPTVDDLAFLSQPGLHFADLEARLGMPEINFLDIGVVVYSWRMRAGFLIWGLGTTGGAGSVDQTRDLLIAYDANGGVLAHAVEKRRLVGQDAYEHARNWRRGLGIAPLSSHADGGADSLVDIHVYVPTIACLGLLKPLTIDVDGRPVARIKGKGSVLTRAKPGTHSFHVTPKPFCADCNPQLRYSATPVEVVVRAGNPLYLRLCHETTREGGWWAGTQRVKQDLREVDVDTMVAELPVPHPR